MRAVHTPMREAHAAGFEMRLSSTLSRSSLAGPLRRQLEVADAEERASGVVGHALDLPTVRQHDLLDDGQPQAGALFVGREVGFEDLGALMFRNARAIIDYFQARFRCLALAGQALDL